MRKNVFLFAIGLFSFLPHSLCASVADRASSSYSLAFNVGYGHNLTYGSIANFDLEAYLPINQHFDAQASIRVSTADIYTFGIQLRPKFALPVGELYLEDRIIANLVQRSDMHDFVNAISVGYMMQYVNVQFGMFSRVLVPQPYKSTSGDELICEPFNLLYRVEANVRPATSPWNISLALANFDHYQMERMWQPMFYLGGRYDINLHWRVNIQGKLKLAGMFHLNAHYYASEISVGAEYRF